jgi:predicted  nucleic acid-binding Zn ribbon protein
MFKRGHVHLHAQTLHDCTRADVRGHGKRYNFWQSQYLEANVQSASGGFSGEAFTPVRLRQSPQNLNARRYGQIILWDV